MKKFLVTILAFVYLATTTGATIHMHYCMGKIYSVDLLKKDKCTKCGMEASEGCCNDELKVLKLKDNHQPAGNAITFDPGFAIVDTHYNITDHVDHKVATWVTTNKNSPPSGLPTPLYLLNRVFRL